MELNKIIVHKARGHFATMFTVCSILMLKQVGYQKLCLNWLQAELNLAYAGLNLDRNVTNKKCFKSFLTVNLIQALFDQSEFDI